MVITSGMKTAISLPNDLFATADAFARRERLSRSELIARALREYLERHDQDCVTAQLDAVCADVDTRLSLEFARASLQVIERDEW
jgi:predicted transcriptional regulator